MVSSSARISLTSSAGSTSRETTSCPAANCSLSGLQNPWRSPSHRPPQVSPRSSAGRASLLEAERRRVMASGTVLVVGGTRGLGREVAQFYAGKGRDVVVPERE